MKYLLRFTLLLIGLTSAFHGIGQERTVGVLSHSTKVYPGYTLLAPSSTNAAYMIDVCGRVVHKWDTNMRPALRTQLTQDGILIRTGRVFGNFAGGGIGGEIAGYDWDGNQIWDLIYADNEVHLHHDFDVLPNGNILAIAWEILNYDESVAVGRNPSTINVNRGMWPDHLIEYNPALDSIVWHWHVIDHLIQDFDSTKLNFGVLAENPQLLDINLINPTNGDWNHFNAVFYNADLDQIVLSSRTMSEIYVIDHSTTIEEARSHTGGKYNKGGDFLYRWGNPSNYDRGETEDRKLFGQHDARWIEKGPNQGSLMVYNNGSRRPEGNFSTIEIIDPPFENNEYLISPSLAFEPLEPETIISGEMGNTRAFYSDRISGAQQFENGNIFVCVGIDGLFYEFDSLGNIVWEYQNPLDGALPVEQGELPFSAQIFKAERYPFDYPAFADKILEPGQAIEINPMIDDCILLTSNSNTFASTISLSPNPAKDRINLSEIEKGNLSIWNLHGEKLMEYHNESSSIELNIEALPEGMYFLRTKNSLAKFIKI